MSRLIHPNVLAVSGGKATSLQEFITAWSDPSFLWMLFVIVLWISCGYSMIIFNKLVLSTWHFNYPFFLTAWHTFVATVSTQIVFAAFPAMLPGVQEGKVSRRVYFETLLPASVFFVAGVVLGNSAYAYITVGYIQMIKAITPVPLFLLYVARGREHPSWIQLLIVLSISLGVMIASVGELQFTWIGFFIQFSAVCCDCMRLLTTDAFFKDSKIDSLSVLYYTAPTSCVLVTVGWYLFESKQMHWEVFNAQFIAILVANGLLAFSLNFAALLAMKTTSGLVIAVCGPLKDILVIVTSTVVFASPVTPLQCFGFSVSIVGIFLYQQYKKDPVLFVDQAIGAVRWAEQCSPCPSSSASLPPHSQQAQGGSPHAVSAGSENDEEQQGLLLTAARGGAK